MVHMFPLLFGYHVAWLLGCLFELYSRGLQWGLTCSAKYLSHDVILQVLALLRIGPLSSITAARRPRRVLVDVLACTPIRCEPAPFGA